jgi:erythromycin esterase-like protein
MGQYLKQELGVGYYSVGFIFSQGNFNAVQYAWVRTKDPSGKRGKKTKTAELNECFAPVIRQNKLSALLSTAPYPDYFLDLQSTSNPAFQKPLRAYNIGAVYDNPKTFSVYFTLKNQFDGVIFLNKIHAAASL